MHTNSWGEGKKVIRTRWVVCNKGDNTNFDVRARLVACEVATTKCDDYFASTPPLESKRLLVSELATKPNDEDGSPRALSFVDVKKAYFNGIPKMRLHFFFRRSWGCPRVPLHTSKGV